MEYLIPDHLFDHLSSPLLILILAIAIGFLAKGADWLVSGAVALSRSLGVPPAIVGATVVSLGTTMPEMAVSVLAAWRGMPDFALGNSVGSIICDTALIFGVACMLTRIPMDRFLLNRHGWLQLGSGILLVLVCIPFRDGDGNPIIPRFVGFTFMGLLVGYLVLSLYWARQQGRVSELEEAASEVPKSLWIAAGLMALGIVIVIFSSHVMIQSVRVLAERWGVPPSVIAATLIAFGTSLPELVTAIACVIKKQPGLLVGNIIGADILNVLFVTGAAASAVSLRVDPLFFSLHFPVMIGVLIIFRAAAYMAKDYFPRWIGVVLFLTYLFYLVKNVI